MESAHSEILGFDKLGLVEQEDHRSSSVVTPEIREEFLEPFDFVEYDLNKPGVLLGKGKVGLGTFLSEEKKIGGSKTSVFISDHWEKTILVSEKKQFFSIDFFDNSMLPNIIKDPYDIDRKGRREVYLQTFSQEGEESFGSRNVLFLRFLRDFTLALIQANPDKQLKVSTYDEKRAYLFETFAKKYGLEDRIFVTLQ